MHWGCLNREGHAGVESTCVRVFVCVAWVTTQGMWDLFWGHSLNLALLRDP